jgi:3-phenylpropionate/cinnamic acid dioxygenase small subunit
VADSAREIEHLLYAYAERLDAGDLDGVADLFAHGRICGVKGGPPSTVFEGREGVRRMYEVMTRLYEDGTPKTKHVTTNVRVEVDEQAGTASARAYFTVFQATPVLPLQAIISGRYEDTFARVDGSWAFDTRTMLVDLVGDLSQHLKAPVQV